MYRLENIEAAGLVLKQRREALKLTQAEVAASAGLTRARLSLIERGLTNVSLASYLRLSAALGGQLVLEDASDRPTLHHLRRASGDGGTAP